MSKHNFFVTFLAKISLSINSLLKKYLNKLNLNNSSYIIQSNKIFLIFITLIILFLSYLSLPNIYDKVDIRKELKNQLFNKFSLNFNFSQNLRYNFFPRPHFIIENSTIFKEQNRISKIKKIKVYISLNNLFSLNNIKVNDLILENANFNLNNQTYDFFIRLLSANFKDSNLTIKDSNIFYRNADDEVLFINKISKMKYYYDAKDLRNIVISKNEIFNLPYSLELYDNKIDKKIFYTLSLNSLKLKIINEIDYTTSLIKGTSKIILNKNKSNIDYQIKKKSLTFNLSSKPGTQDFSYEGEINFNPFYANLEGKTKKIDLSSLFNSNALFIQLLKTETINNKNLNFYLNITGNKIQNYENFKNVLLSSKIQEGLIDFDNTKFSWKDYVNFRISDSLLLINDNELILDGKINILIKNFSEVYKFLQTPKNYRTEIKKVELSFNYNFDQKILGFNDIKINNQINQNFNNIMKSLLLKDDMIKNKIYFKNKINKAIKAYAG